MSDFSYLPKYQQVIKYIESIIESNNLKPGDMLPTEKKLQDSLGVSRVTVRKAIDSLINEGVLDSTQGSGTFVKKNKALHNIFSLNGFTEEMEGQNFKINNKISTFQIETASAKLIDQFQLKNDLRVYHIVRTRYLNDKPILVEVSYMPFYLFNDLSIKILEGSKYDYIEKEKKYTILESQQTITPVLPKKDIAKLLLIDEKLPILKIDLLSFLDDNRVFEVNTMYYSTENVNFSLTAKRMN